MMATSSRRNITQHSTEIGDCRLLHTVHCCMQFGLETIQTCARNAKHTAICRAVTGAFSRTLLLDRPIHHFLSSSTRQNILWTAVLHIKLRAWRRLSTTPTFQSLIYVYTWIKTINNRWTSCSRTMKVYIIPLYFKLTYNCFEPTWCFLFMSESLRQHLQWEWPVILQWY